jgi:NADPH-dependent curcumin reductase CurA
MADVSVFSVSGSGNDAKATASVAGAAAVQTVPCGKDSRLALRVSNGNETAAVVRVTPGSGPRAALGNMDVTVAAGATAYIALFDTARYKSGSAISVSLVDATGTALGATALGGIGIEAVQL